MALRDYDIAVCTNLTPKLVDEIMELAKDYGFINCYHYTPTQSVCLNQHSKRMLLTFAESRLNITHNHINFLTTWFKACGFKTAAESIADYKKEKVDLSKFEEPNITPTPNPQPPMDNVYELMVNDVKTRLMSELQNLLPKLPDEEGIQQLIAGKVTEEFARRGTVTITLEDRRKVPAETKIISEAAHEKLPDLFGTLKAGCWAAVVGPSGGGKTLGVLQFCKLADIKMVAIKQMTRIIAPHDLIGYMDANGHYRKGAWTDVILGYEYKSQENGVPTAEPTTTPAILLVDEMDNSNENVIMLLKAVNTGQIAMPYGLQRVNPLLQVVATMNTWGNGATREYVGRCAQDAALLNEFSFIEWDYDEKFEWKLLEQLYNSYESAGEWKLIDFQRLHDTFRMMRNKAEKEKVRVIISTRNLINSAKLLVCNPEWTVGKVLRMTVFKGLKQEEVQRIECPELWTAHKEKSETKVKVTDTRQVISSSPFSIPSTNAKGISEDTPF